MWIPPAYISAHASELCNCHRFQQYIYIHNIFRAFNFQYNVIKSNIKSNYIKSNNKKIKNNIKENKSKSKSKSKTKGKRKSNSKSKSNINGKSKSKSNIRKTKARSIANARKPRKPLLFFKPSFGTRGRTVQKRVTVVTFQQVDNAGIVEL